VLFAAILAISIAIGVRLVPIFALLPVLVASAIARRFASRRVVLTSGDDLTIGTRVVRHDAIVDVWQDELRVTVAFAGELAAFVFDDADVAARFVAALPPSKARAAGHRPTPVDALAPLRFLAVAGAFFATGSWLGAIALIPFARGAWALVVARHVVVDDTRMTLDGLFGTRTIALEDVREIDGTYVVLGSGARVRIDTRDALLETPLWVLRARDRVLQ
jgi:hypothetical protein